MKSSEIPIEFVKLMSLALRNTKMIREAFLSKVFTGVWFKSASRHFSRSSITKH